MEKILKNSDNILIEVSNEKEGKLVDFVNVMSEGYLEMCQDPKLDTDWSSRDQLRGILYSLKILNILKERIRVNLPWEVRETGIVFVKNSK
jgi:hypothetical protein